MAKNGTRGFAIKTYDIEEGEHEKKVVENPVHSLSRERPDGYGVPDQSQQSYDEDEQSLGHEPKHSSFDGEVFLLAAAAGHVPQI